MPGYMILLFLTTLDKCALHLLFDRFDLFAHKSERGHFITALGIETGSVTSTVHLVVTWRSSVPIPNSLKSASVLAS
jgi:hypothetical protein